MGLLLLGEGLLFPPSHNYGLPWREVTIQRAKTPLTTVIFGGVPLTLVSVRNKRDFGVLPFPYTLYLTSVVAMACSHSPAHEI